MLQFSEKFLKKIFLLKISLFNIKLLVMNLYVIQVNTGKEDTYIKLWEHKKGHLPLKIFWLRKELMIRKNGHTHKGLKSIFPGYLFLEADEIDAETFQEFRHIHFFNRFLKADNKISPLPLDEAKKIYELAKYGRVIGQSKVVYNEQDRIVVIDGPMKGLEGQIVKVDRRKKRAKVRLSLYNNAYLIDFGFELLEEANGVNNVG